MTAHMLAIGTLPQWGSFLSLVAIIMGGIIVYIKGIPERGRVRNEATVIDVDADTVLRAEYVEQIKEFRREVHGYRNELQVIQGELTRSESASRRRGDRIRNMEFVIRLLVSELKRLQPNGSIVVDQAEAMMAQMDRDGAEDGRHKSTALQSAETAVTAARKTVRSAEHTVVEINVNEASGGTDE
jgi:hypothetical protein